MPEFTNCALLDARDCFYFDKTNSSKVATAGSRVRRKSGLFECSYVLVFYWHVSRNFFQVTSEQKVYEHRLYALLNRHDKQKHGPQLTHAGSLHDVAAKSEQKEAFWQQFSPAARHLNLSETGNGSQTVQFFISTLVQLQTINAPTQPQSN